MTPGTSSGSISRSRPCSELGGRAKAAGSWTPSAESATTTPRACSGASERLHARLVAPALDEVQASRRAIKGPAAPASVQRQQRRAGCSYPCNPASGPQSDRQRARYRSFTSGTRFGDGAEPLYGSFAARVRSVAPTRRSTAASELSGPGQCSRSSSVPLPRSTARSVRATTSASSM
jgi:hypothetical protein